MFFVHSFISSRLAWRTKIRTSVQRSIPQEFSCHTIEQQWEQLLSTCKQNRAIFFLSRLYRLYQALKENFKKPIHSLKRKSLATPMELNPCLDLNIGRDAATSRNRRFRGVWGRFVPVMWVGCSLFEGSYTEMGSLGCLQQLAKMRNK